ncbi:MAG TPA: hypothetical protein VGM05_11220 [Planctomycetaceae bacterium]|jgi:hypothetical protein
MSETAFTTVELWERHAMAIEDVTQRFLRVTAALDAANVPYALVGGQAVALWIATKDPEAVRVTKDVDLLVRRDDLPAVRKAGLSIGMDYFEVLGVGMLLEQDNPNPRRAVHLIWAGEKVRPENVLASPDISDIHRHHSGKSVIPLLALVQMKLMANRDQDRVHLRDMIGVDLLNRDMLTGLPPELATRLDILLTEEGR